MRLDTQNFMRTFDAESDFPDFIHDLLCSVNDDGSYTGEPDENGSVVEFSFFEVYMIRLLTLYLRQREEILCETIGVTALLN